MPIEEEEKEETFAELIVKMLERIEELENRTDPKELTRVISEHIKKQSGMAARNTNHGSI